jgi:hypothetical protein
LATGSKEGDATPSSGNWPARFRPRIHTKGSPRRAICSRERQRVDPAFVSIGACRPKALRRMVHSWATIEPRNTQTTRKQRRANIRFLPGFRVVGVFCGLNSGIGSQRRLSPQRHHDTKEYLSEQIFPVDRPLCLCAFVVNTPMVGFRSPILFYHRFRGCRG